MPAVAPNGWWVLRGFSLVELLVAMAIGAVLLTGLVQIAAGARSSYRLQESLAEVQESGRFVVDSLGSILRQSIYSDRPWSDPPSSLGFSPDTADAVTSNGDRLGILTRSDRNCFGNPNPVLDASGKPEFFLRESILELNASKNLAHTCRYGPEQASLITQIQREGLAQNVEAFQALYAEDTDGDGYADSWVRGGEWASETRVMGFRLAVLISSTESVTAPSPATYQVLDLAVTPAADGRLLRVFGYAQAFPGRRE